MQLLLKRYKRKVNKVIKGGSILSILFAFFISLVIPPFNIFADDYSGSTIQGFNVSLIDVEQTLVNSGGTSGYMSKYIYEVEFILDDSYVGYINISGEIKFYPYNSSTLTIYNLPGRNYFVNGTSFKLTFQLTGDGYTADNRPSLNNTVFTYGNHNLYKHSEIDSLETIIDLLTDLYNNTDTVEGLLNSELTQLQLIAQKCNIANQYLEILTQIRQWKFPFESFSAVYPFWTYNEPSDIYEYNYNSSYPMFDLTNKQGYVARLYISANDSYDFIFISNSGSLNSFNQRFDLSQNVDSISQVRVSEAFRIKGNPYYLLQIRVSVNQGKNIYLSYTGSDSSIYFIPIYWGRTSNKYISTDFALEFGLSNELLDNLNVIAQGTTQSNTSSSNLETQKDSFDTTLNDLYTSENAFNTDMNNKLQSIDTSFNPSTSFGSKFLSSADWVRTQFNNLTSTSPFGTVLSFSMLLGLSLMIIGKVFK